MPGPSNSVARRLPGAAGRHDGRQHEAGPAAGQRVVGVEQQPAVRAGFDDAHREQVAPRGDAATEQACRKVTARLQVGGQAQSAAIQFDARPPGGPAPWAGIEHHRTAALQRLFAGGQPSAVALQCRSRDTQAIDMVRMLAAPFQARGIARGKSRRWGDGDCVIEWAHRAAPWRSSRRIGAPMSGRRAYSSPAASQ
jgi:hypothetical protein